MPKQKTHKGLAKRVKITATGKVKFKRSCGGHLMSGKSAKRRRRISKSAIMSNVMAKKAKIRLP
jgi:large subunit ribosomal protein L35